MKPGQRFIAGAVCPQCNEMDSLLLDTNDQSIECVDCEYRQTEAQRDAAQHDNQAAPETVPENIKISNIIQITNIKN